MTRPQRTLTAALFSASIASAGTAHAAETPSLEEMWRIIQSQQETIEDLEAQLARTREAADSAGRKAEAVEARTDAVADLVEESATTVAGPAEPATRGATLGGYGELHYNNLDSKDEVDFHRFVLYAGYDFTDRIHFFSELELEHALTEDTADGSGPGEVELEQAWVQLDLSDRHHLRAGLDVLPIGIINWTHEPNTFFGVERNRVENVIIPATWWEAMAGLNGELAPGWNYDVLVHSGLDTPTTGANAFRIRSGRSKIAKADASDAAVTGRLRYTGVPGLELGVSAQYQQDVTQSDPGALDVDATLFEGHAVYRRGMFGFRALGARWDLDEGPAGIGPGANGRDEQYGFYLEPALYFDAPGNLPGEVGVFGRYSYVDDMAGSAAETEIEEVYAGLNYWPHPGVVFKLDLQNQLDGGDDGFNLGLGYAF